MRRFAAAAAILLLAAGLRIALAAAWPSATRHEAQALGIAAESQSPAELLRLAAEERGAPLPYLMLWPLAKTMGLSLPALRAAEVVFGFLATLLAMALGGAAYQSPLSAGLLVAASPWLTRDPSSVLSLLHALAFLAFLRRPGLPAAAGWGLAAAAAALSSYVAAFSVLLAFLYALYRFPTRAGVALLGVAFSLVAVPFSPWVPSLVEQYLREVRPWQTRAPDLSSLGATLRLPLGLYGAPLVLLALVLCRRGSGSAAVVWLSVGAGALAWAARLQDWSEEPGKVAPLAILLLPALGAAGAAARRPAVRGLLLAAALACPWFDDAVRPRPASPAPEFARRLEEQRRTDDLLWFVPPEVAPVFLLHHDGPERMLAYPLRGELHRVDRAAVAEHQRDEALAREMLAELVAQVEGGGRVWMVLDAGCPVRDPADPGPAPEVHRRALALLRERALLAEVVTTPESDYQEPLTLALFLPRR